MPAASRKPWGRPSGAFGLPSIDRFLTPLVSPIIHPGGSITFSPVGPGGPLLLDNQGRTLWFKQLLPSVVASALEPARYDNQPVLTWWQGVVTALDFGVGKGVIADSSYHTVAEVNAGNGYAADIHEFHVTADGDALLAIYQPIRPAGWVPGQPLLTDAIIQQVDIKTGLVKWEWHALGHIPTSDAYLPPINGFFDPFHINSVQERPDGTVVASLRNTSAIYRIDKSTGNIVWTLGGKESSFSFGAGARFWFQHDARMLSNDTISLFDDEAGPPNFAPTSRGLVLSLDLTRKVASVAGQYTRPQATLADSQGSTQILDNGDVFAGFGSEPNFSQFTAGGTIVFDAALPDDDGSYRILRGTWNATPDTVPNAAAVRTSATDVTVSASWNGATKVARWQVLAGDSVDSLSPVATADWSGFETSIPVSTMAGTFKVQALDADGKILATSAAVTAP